MPAVGAELPAVVDHALGSEGRAKATGTSWGGSGINRFGR